MPKMKTHKGSAKRFKLTGNGKIRRRKAYSNHLFISKTPKQKRNLRRSALVDETNEKRLRRLLPN